MVDHFPILEEIADRRKSRVLSGSTRANHRLYLAVLRRVAWPRDLIGIQPRAYECLSSTTPIARRVRSHGMLLVETYRFRRQPDGDLHVGDVNRMNDIVKTLTTSAIFIPLTFLAGVYGMNMPIPENNLPWTYPLFWLASIGAAAAMLYGFRRRGWL
jgi:magnesium transporter